MGRAELLCRPSGLRIRTARTDRDICRSICLEEGTEEVCTLNRVMNFKTRLFFILWAAGMAGVLSLLLIDVEALIAMLSLPPGTDIPMSVPVLEANLLQPAVLLALAVMSGVGLASRVGLSSPVAEAIAGGGNVGSAIKSQIVPGLIGGLAGGVSLVTIAALPETVLDCRNGLKA